MIIYFVKKDSETVYIGQTCQPLANRKGKHFSEARKGRGSVFGAGIRKHGEEAFTFEIFKEVENQIECCELEKHLIGTLNPRYNMQEGGKLSFTAWNKGKKLSKKICKNLTKAAKTRKRTKRGKYSKEHTDKIGQASLKSSEKPFKCLNNGMIYLNKVTAGKNLGIDPRGITAVLCNSHRAKSYKGFQFHYVLAQDKFSLIDLDTRKRATGRKANSHRERLNEKNPFEGVRQSGLRV